MKIKRIIYILILSMVLITLINPKKCLAMGLHENQIVINDGGGGGSNTEEAVEGNGNIGLPSLDESYKPTASLGSASSKVSTVLSILIVLGIVATVIGISLIGFGAILGSAGEKAEAQTKIVGIVVAGILITGGCTIAKMLISMAEKI